MYIDIPLIYIHMHIQPILLPRRDPTLLDLLGAEPTHCAPLPIFFGQGPPFMKSETKSVVLHFVTAAGQQAPGFDVHSGAFRPLFALA